MAGTLILEAIVVLLALPVVGAVGGGLTTFSMAYLIGFAVVLVLLAGVQGRSWAIWANLAVQVVLIAGWAIYPGVGFIGVRVRRGVAADRLSARRGAAPAEARTAAGAAAARLSRSLPVHPQFGLCAQVVVFATVTGRTVGSSATVPEPLSV